MNNIQTDFHGYKVSQAIAELDKMIFKAVTSHTATTLKLITGKGKIKEAVINYVESCGLDWLYHDMSEGCIVVYYFPEEESL